MIKFLQLIADEKDGFSFGRSWRYDEDSLAAILPILRVSSLKRKYLLLSEAKNIQIRDSGQINKVMVESNEKKPVYIRMGEIFSGSTQERMATRSYVIMPGEKIAVDVRCVYASKGINIDATMTSGGIAPSVFDSHLASAGFKMRSVEQREVWKSVDTAAQNFCCSMRDLDSAGKGEFYDVASGSTAGLETFSGHDGTFIADQIRFTDDLKGNIDMFNERIKDVLKKVPHFESQVGMVMIDLKGIAAIECFDLKESWKAMKDKIIGKEGEKISKRQAKSPFQYREDRAKEFSKILLKAEYEEKTLFKSKDWRVIGLKNPNYVGEIVELNDKPIHLTLVRSS